MFPVNLNKLSPCFTGISFSKLTNAVSLKERTCSRDLVRFGPEPLILLEK